MINLYNFFKKGAFRIDPERAHELSISMLSKHPMLAQKLIPSERPSEEFCLKTNSGIWSFPIGLAAGLDKNAECIDYFSRLLFGAVEVGTITPLPQEGNPRPRLFRYPEEESLRNCMGFNNKGANFCLQNIIKAKRNGKIIGVNLGKNKVTSQEKAAEDYRKLYKIFAPEADYLVVNLSSPNTPGLRDLLATSSLKEIFSELTDERSKSPVPLYLKISPDMAMEQIPEITQLAQEFQLAGIIATNTTIMEERGAGGVSGRLLYQKAHNMRAEVLKHLQGQDSVELIGVGGFASFSDVFEFWKLGGRAVQIYSSFIYQGPQILNDISIEIKALMKREQVSSLEELLDNISSVSMAGN